MNPVASGYNPNPFGLVYGASGAQAQDLDAKKIGAWSSDSVYFKDAGPFGVKMPEVSPAGFISSPAVSNPVKEFILSVDKKEDMAAEMRASILSGESNNLHQTMIASQEASVAFSLMIEMRNKVMETYQELMRLQL